MLSDRDFVDAFDHCELADFHHADHVRLGWIFLRELPLIAALERFASALKRFATANGKPELYHETITWAYLLLIHERMQRSALPDFEAFAAANADLMTWKPSVLDRYYRAETLASDLARRTFVMPDRVG